jgi:hypothetical protein
MRLTSHLRLAHEAAGPPLPPKSSSLRYWAEEFTRKERPPPPKLIPVDLNRIPPIPDGKQYKTLDVRIAENTFMSKGLLIDCTASSQDRAIMESQHLRMLCRILMPKTCHTSRLVSSMTPGTSCREPRTCLRGSYFLMFSQDIRTQHLLYLLFQRAYSSALVECARRKYLKKRNVHHGSLFRSFSRCPRKYFTNQKTRARRVLLRRDARGACEGRP